MVGTKTGRWGKVMTGGEAQRQRKYMRGKDAERHEAGYIYRKIWGVKAAGSHGGVCGHNRGKT